MVGDDVLKLSEEVLDLVEELSQVHNYIHTVQCTVSRPTSKIVMADGNVCCQSPLSQLNNNI